MTVTKTGDNTYKLLANLYTNWTAKNFEIEAPVVKQRPTEAGDVEARCFIVTANAQKGEGPFALWCLELEYKIDSNDSKPYEYLEIVIDYGHRPGPETSRGTVTTVEDPAPPGISK